MRIALLLLSLSLVPASAFANSGAAFLKLGAGARAHGLGSAYTAAADDVSALYWNPAGLARLEKREAAAMHAELYQDTRYDFIGYAQPAAGGAFGAAAYYLSQGSLEGRAADRSRAGDFSSSDFAVALSGSRRIASGVTLGASAKLVRSQIAAQSANGFAVDLGAQWKSEQGAALGASVLNLGPSLKFDRESFRLPLSLAAGAGVPVLKYFLVTADVRHYPHDRRTVAGAGAEVSVGSLAALRMGYTSNLPKLAGGSQPAAASRLADFSGFGMGIGFGIRRVRFDYAFTPMGELGNSQRFSVAVRF